MSDDARDGPAGTGTDVAEVDVHGISSEGAGVARLPDGRVVFVHRTAPGDRARVRVRTRKKAWARAELVELLEASGERREPPCPHYDRCGGCTLEHMEYGAQLRWKGRILADALERIGGLDEVEAPEVAPSPEEFRYRSRITLTLKRLKGDRVVAGFHELENPGRIVDVGEECLLPMPAVARALHGLRRAWGPGAARLPSGRRLRLTLRRVDEGVILLVEGGRGEGAPGTLVDEVPELVAVWRTGDGGSRILAGDADTHVTWMGERTPVRAGAFLQVNREAAAPLHEAILGCLRPAAGATIVDAYAGLGTVGRTLAREGAEVRAIELDPEAAAGARRNAPDGFRVLEGAVEDRLASALPAQRAVLNPPRTGLHERVPELLLERPPERLVYVSCDPATLARDLERLSPGYRLTELEARDLFPQTPHVECLAVFDAREGTRP